MQGNIVNVLVAVGDVVKQDQAVLVTETMKMETEVRAAHAGTVTSVDVAPGDAVQVGDSLLTLA